MCDHHRLRTQPSLGEVEHVNFLSENIGGLFMQESYSDITLLVENVRFPTHKVILAARSEYFRALLFGGLRESRSGCAEIEMKDTSAGAFKHLLKYIYTGRMNLSDLKEELLLDVLGLAHQYGFTQLEDSISTYLRAILNVRNVCLIYDIGSMYNLDSLSQKCCEFMDRNAAEILASDAFLTLSSPALHEVLSRDSFCAPEVDIFHAVKRWSEHNPEEDPKAVIEVVRLPLMNLDDLLNNVRTSNLVSADAILDAIKVKNESRDMDLKYRGFLTPEENVASLRHGAQVIRGEMKAALLDGDTQNYDLDRGFTRHPIDDSQCQGIVVKLGQPSIINTIKLLLWDKDMRSYSYYIEVSMDDKDWVRVVDHRKFLCRSWQYLRFSARVARYVRIVGTRNTVNRVFHLVSFMCMFSNVPFELDNGIIVPKENVATIEASACVIEGVSRSRNALINGDTKNYDWDSGYTCHQLGSGVIIVQLAQPYMIDSMRLLLWDCDGRSYSYYVEVSVDQVTWHLVADKTREACRSWQVITFDKQPITFVKIVGTHNTANEVFHCVHFECPADATALMEKQSEHNKSQMTSNAVSMTTASSSSASSYSSSAGVPNLSPSVFSTANIPTQPVVAMARVNPMPANAIDLSQGAMGGGTRMSNPTFSVPALAHSVPNRPDILEAESDDSLENGLHGGAMNVVGVMPGYASGSGVGSGDPSGLERENLQGVRIVWVDRGDGLGMENSALGGEDLPGSGSPRLDRSHSPQGSFHDQSSNSPRAQGGQCLTGGHRYTAGGIGAIPRVRPDTHSPNSYRGSGQQGQVPQGLDPDLRPGSASPRSDGVYFGADGVGSVQDHLHQVSRDADSPASSESNLGDGR